MALQQFTECDNNTYFDSDTNTNKRNIFRMAQHDTLSNYSVESSDSADSADSADSDYLTFSTCSNTMNQLDYINMLEIEKKLQYNIPYSPIYHVINRQWDAIKNKRSKHERRQLKLKFEQQYNGGVTSKLTKETPIIKYLIKKRMVSIDDGPSNHIAAILPDDGIKHCCYLRGFGKASYW